MGERKDTLFKNSFRQVKSFAFDDQVVRVFPDMIKRSIPGYETILRGIGMFAMRYVKPNSCVYDIGCSLGAVALTVDKVLDDSFPCSIVAIDSSKPMVREFRKTLEIKPTGHDIDVRLGRIQNEKISNASMVVSNFTLQFISEIDRVHVLNNIYQGLNQGGVFVLSEKIKSNQFLIDHYHGYKKINGYSDQEIMRKRNALEKVLVPQSKQEWDTALKNSGFSTVELWFQSFNFVSWLCVKNAK